VQAVVIGDPPRRDRQPARSQRHAAGPRLRPQQRSYAADLAIGEQLERAEPGVQRRDRAERATRRPGAPQRQVVPPQLAEAARATHAKVIIRQRRRGRRAVVDHDRLCVAARCATTRSPPPSSPSSSADFTRSYYELLGDRPRCRQSGRPLINQYYSPFGPT